MAEQTAIAPEIHGFVEQMGLLWEGERLPRIAGRIFGLLAVSADPLSLDDMMQILGVSKASISTDARRLVDIGLLERTALPGDRRDYYMLVHDAPRRMIALRLAKMRRFSQAFDQLRTANAAPQAAERLAGFSHLFERVLVALTATLDDLGGPPESNGVHATRSGKTHS